MLHRKHTASSRRLSHLAVDTSALISDIVGVNQAARNQIKAAKVTNDGPMGERALLELKFASLVCLFAESHTMK